MTIVNFSDLPLSGKIQQAVAEKGYTSPSPIQAQAIPAVLEGHDVMAAAQTGTGKTAGFTLPILQILSKGEYASSNQVRALVLTPTRELAAQVGDSVATYGKYLPLHSEIVFGGVKINPQMKRLRSGADILIATPGRLLDLFNQNAIKFDRLEVLVLDEADRMLDMGFIHDIRRILKVLPSKRQNLLFSATFSDAIRQLAKTIVNSPVEISVTPRNSTSENVKQWLVPVDKSKKTQLLAALIKEHNWQQVLVFCRTKHGANRVAKTLTGQGLNAAAIHGNKSQGARTKALAEFKSGDVRVLVATDIAARGIDINQLPQVVNLDLPHVSEDYVHRIGRTGRAGAQGQAVSLVCADEIKELKGIERLIKQLIRREYVDGFIPSHEVPESKLDTRPIKAPRPKKPKDRPRQEQSGKPPANERRPKRSRNSGGKNTGNNRGNSANKPKTGEQSKKANPYKGKGGGTGTGNSKPSNGNSQRRQKPKPARNGNQADGNQKSKAKNY